jgi:hypothetical protein
MFGKGRRLGFSRLALLRPGFWRRLRSGQMRRWGEAEHSAERAQQPGGLRGGGTEGDQFGIVEQGFDARGELRHGLMQPDQPGMT